MGLRRFRPGPGTAPIRRSCRRRKPNPDWLDHEISIIDRALQEQGELDRRELAERVGARYWGPGRFRAALRGAVERRRRPARGPRPLRVRAGDAGTAGG